MKPQKSSKKLYITVVFFVFLIGISIGGYLVLNSRFSQADIKEKLSQILENDKKEIKGCQPNPDDKNKDSDNDGLMDWQEIVHKTNSCKPDSDGDGYLDGEEVASGYDPAKSAPGDELEGAQGRGLPKNLTQALAENIGAQMIEGKLGNISSALDSSAIQTSNQVVNDAINQTILKAMEEFSLPEIPDNEIIISSDNSQAAIENYAGEIVKTIDQWQKKVSLVDQNEPEGEAGIFLEAIQSRDFRKIDKYIESYSGIAEALKQIPVPSNFKEIHKEQIGIFEVLSNIYSAVKEIDQDPLKTVLAIEKYSIVFESTKQMFLKLADLLK